MAISYEWDIEEVDENGDIQDHDFHESIEGFGVRPTVDEQRYFLVLVRTSGTIDDGVIDRTWAYATRNGGVLGLPESFENGIRVPKRYQEELAKAAL